MGLEQNDDATVTQSGDEASRTLRVRRELGGTMVGLAVTIGVRAESHGQAPRLTRLASLLHFSPVRPQKSTAR